jgi:hypothetical protein
MRNIFPKYLETLFSGKSEVHNEKLRTMENILLKELKVSFEQTKRIESLVKQHQDKSKTKWNSLTSVLKRAAPQSHR